MKSVRKIYFQKADDVPNNTLPVLLYRGVLAANTADKAKLFRERFKSNGWSGVWTDTIYDYNHFHSNAHEVLGIAEGRVTLGLGGKMGSLFRLKAGDMLILPAGVGHRRVGDDDGLKVIGACPRGQSHYDMKRKGRAIPKLQFPTTDPFFGDAGPLILAWRHQGSRSLGVPVPRGGRQRQEHRLLFEPEPRQERSDGVLP